MSTSLLEPTTSAVRQLGPLPDDGHWPAWMAQEQAAAWAEYEATPVPKRTDEAWRFSDIKRLDLSAFHMAGPVTHAESLIAASTGAVKISARFVIGNNHVLHRETSGLPEGVIALPLEEAIQRHEDLFRSYFLRQPVELGSHKYARLHHACLRTGVLLYVPPGAVIPDPVEIHYWVEGKNSSVFPHTLLILGEDSQATVLDYFHTADGEPALACGINDLHLAARSKLHYVAIQDWSPTSTAFHLNSTIVGENAVSTALTLNFGGNFVRGESLSEMTEPGARSIMLSINPTDGDRLIDQRTLQLHSAPGATSDLLYHNTLDDKARTIFAGLIKVAQGAHRTDAYQKVRNLLLSDEAEANSMPGLEILADEVKCSHGATSGELNQDELFYLAARGIPASTARRMIVLGFFDSLLERIEDLTLRSFLSERMRARFG